MSIQVFNHDIECLYLVSVQRFPSSSREALSRILQRAYSLQARRKQIDRWVQLKYYTYTHILIRNGLIFFPIVRLKSQVNAYNRKNTRFKTLRFLKLYFNENMSARILCNVHILFNSMIGINNYIQNCLAILCFSIFPSMTVHTLIVHFWI